MNQLADLLRIASWLALLGALVLLGGKILDQVKTVTDRKIR